MQSKLLYTILLAMVLAASAPMALSKGQNGDRAFTAWAFIFHNPENCATVPCGEPDIGPANAAVIYLTGQRVQSNGRVIFAGAISVDSTHGQVGGPAEGMMDTTTEIHIGLQSHGDLARDPAVRYTQTTTPGGGCMPACGLQQAAIFMPGDTQTSVIRVPERTVVEGSTATIERSISGIIVALDTRL